MHIHVLKFKVLLQAGCQSMQKRPSYQGRALDFENRMTKASCRIRKHLGEAAKSSVRNFVGREPARSAQDATSGAAGNIGLGSRRYVFNNFPDTASQVKYV